MMVVFRKANLLRHIGHLDLMRTLQRALRRSKLPVHYSKGFNPHIKMSFASPLSVGIAGEREILDVQMDEQYGEAAFLKALNRTLPDSLKAVFARSIGDDFPTLMGLAAGSQYRIEPEVPADTFKEAIRLLLGKGEYVAMRKTKSGESMGDILPYIETLEVADGAIRFTARNLQSGSLKPSVVMCALFTLSDTDPCFYSVTREAILAKDAQGELLPLEVISIA